MNNKRTESGIAAIVGGAVAAMLAVLAMVGGVLALGVENERDASGYISSGTNRYETPTHALATKAVNLDGFGEASAPAGLVRRVQVRVRSGVPVFVGIARSADVKRYLHHVAYESVDGFDEKPREATTHVGAASPAAPADQSLWVASTTGSAAQTLRWHARRGDWQVVVMNPDGAAGVSAGIAVGGEFPKLELAGVLAVLVGLGMAGAAIVLIRAGTRSAGPPRPLAYA